MSSGCGCKEVLIFTYTTPLFFAAASRSFLTLGAHARSEGYCIVVPCVCVCVYVCVSVRSFLLPRAFRP